MISAKAPRSVVFLSMVSVVAFLQMVYQVTLPGPYYDEVYHSVYATWILTGKQLLWGPPFSYTLFGLPILGSLGYYTGPLESYLVFLPLSLLGINILAIRALPIFFAIVTLPFLFFFMRNRFGEASSYVTTMLFAFQPSLLLWSRVGLYPFSILVFFTCSSLYFFDRWLSGRNIRSLVVGFFLLGLGFETFISFTWYIVALGITVGIMRINTHVQRCHLPVVAVSFLAGVGPYLLPWLSGENINFFIRYAQTSYAGVNNLSYVENLFLRMQHLRILIESSGFSFYGGVHSNPLATPLFIASLVGTLPLIYFFKVRGRNAFNPHLFLLTVFTLMLLQTPITISSLNSYQLLPLLPFTLMIVGSFFGWLWNADKTLCKSLHIHKVGSVLKSCKILVLLVLTFSILLDLSTTAAYHTDLKETGGVGRWTNAMYDAADYVLSMNYTYVLAVDWGLSWGLLVASGGKLNVRDLFWAQGEDFKNTANYYIDAGNVHFISWRTPGSWSRLELLRETVTARSESLVIERTFYQADGTPAIDLYTIVR